MRILLIVAFAIQLLTSCNNKKKNGTASNKETTDTATITDNKQPVSEADSHPSIIGKWVLFDLNHKNMDEEEKKKNIGKATIEFTSDGKYIAHSEENDETGTYMYYENTKTLTTVPKGKSEEKLNAEISIDKLTVSNEEGTMIFKRVNE